jgi:hypothetical protein
MPAMKAGFGFEPQGQQHGNRPERQVDQEYRAPAQVLGQVTARDRSERVRGDHDRREIALVTTAFARRHGFSDQRLRQCHEAAAAESLQHTGERQHLDAGRERAKHRGGEEDGKGDEHQPAASEDVAELAIDRSRHGAGDQIGNHHPGDALDSAERCGNRRQRRRDDGLIDDRQEHRQHDRGEDAQKQRSLSGHDRLPGGGGFSHRQGHREFGPQRSKPVWRTGRSRSV